MNRKLNFFLIFLMIIMLMPTMSALATENEVENCVISIDGEPNVFYLKQAKLDGDDITASYVSFDPHGNIIYRLYIYMDSDIAVGSHKYDYKKGKYGVSLNENGTNHMTYKGCDFVLNITERNDTWTEYTGSFSGTIKDDGKVTLSCDAFKFTITYKGKEDGNVANNNIFKKYSMYKPLDDSTYVSDDEIREKVFGRSDNQDEEDTFNENSSSKTDGSSRKNNESKSSQNGSCSYCGGSGICSKCALGDCDKCFGEREVYCPTCGGSRSCTSCYGSGGEYRKRSGDLQWVDCTRCRGDGDCTRCSGSGTITCSLCSGSGKCSSCRGTEECRYCNGTGNGLSGTTTSNDSYGNQKRDKNDSGSNNSTISSNYILENSSSEYLSDDDVRSLTSEQLKYARNEIYARHGRRFKDQTIQAWFDKQTWYKGTIEPDMFNEDAISKVEKANIQLIKKWEEFKKVEDSISQEIRKSKIKL